MPLVTGYKSYSLVAMILNNQILACFKYFLRKKIRVHKVECIIIFETEEVPRNTAKPFQKNICFAERLSANGVMISLVRK